MIFFVPAVFRGCILRVAMLVLIQSRSKPDERFSTLFIMNRCLAFISGQGEFDTRSVSAFLLNRSSDLSNTIWESPALTIRSFST